MIGAAFGGRVMKFVWFTKANGKPVAVNPDRIDAIFGAHNDAGQSLISFGKDDHIIVEGTPEQVVATIDSAAK